MITKREHALLLTDNESAFIDLWILYGNQYSSASAFSEALLGDRCFGPRTVRKYIEIKRMLPYGEHQQLTPLRAAKNQSRYRFEGYRK